MTTMQIVNKIKISTDFTETPGARFREDGEFSAQEFLEDILLAKFEEAVNKNGLLEVDLDDVWGYASSFISGSFGKLSKDKGKDLVLKHITWKSNDDPLLIDKIKAIIEEPNRQA